MANDYNGLTRNTWPGTWSPTGNHPIALDTEIRGGLRTVTGQANDTLTDIPGQRLQEGMLVFLTGNYTSSGGTNYTGNKYYKYKLLNGQYRDPATGNLPNADANWEILDLAGGGGGGIGYTGSQGIIGWTGSQGIIGYTGSQGITGYTGSSGAGALGYTGSRGIVGFTGSSGTVTVGLRDTNNITSNVVTSVSNIQFDKDAGFTVNDLGSGIVKIGNTGTGGGGGGGDTFRYWEVAGQQTLTAQGTDTVRFVAGSGITITTDNNSFPKTIYISAPRFTVNLDCNGVLRPYGLDAYYDGGYPDSVYGGIVPLDAGGVDF